MTTEEKVKAYDEALEKARIFKEHLIEINQKDFADEMEYIFPELTESEDEKIRKDLIKWINEFPDTIWRGHYKKDVIAWLEKQGKEKYLSEPIKDYQGSFTCWNNAHDFRPKHLQRCICYDKYMCGVYCYVYDDISKYWCTQTTEEHDPDGDNHISDYADYRVPVWMPLPDISFYPLKSWLEKQGKQKPYGQRQECADCQFNYAGKCKGYCTMKKDEQKSADKVEPKFKVGDWVIDKQGIVHQIANVIENVTYHTYGYDIVGGGYFNDNTEGVRLWTIQDAKDGDMLYSSDSNQPFIYKSRNDGEQATCYCGINKFGKFFIWNTKDCIITLDKYVPATKDQRDVLFEKMRDAGYEWDAVKKELKKIENQVEQKPKRVGIKETTGTLKEMLNNIDPIELEETRKTMEEIDGFDAELNALLKKYEYLPKEELAECLEFYLGVVNKSEAEMVKANETNSKYQNVVMQMLQSIYEVLVSINNKTPVQVIPYTPQPLTPYYDTSKPYCTSNKIDDDTK